MHESSLKPGSLAALATGEGAQSWLELKELVASVLRFALRQVNFPRTSYACFKLCLLFCWQKRLIIVEGFCNVLFGYIHVHTFWRVAFYPFFPHEAVGEAKRFAGLLWLIRTRSHFSLSFL